MTTPWRPAGAGVDEPIISPSGYHDGGRTLSIVRARKPVVYVHRAPRRPQRGGELLGQQQRPQGSPDGTSLAGVHPKDAAPDLCHRAAAAGETASAQIADDTEPILAGWGSMMFTRTARQSTDLSP